MQPAWKKWLSYIAEIHLESASSEYNPHLYVSLRRGRYQLSTHNAIYSYEDLYDNFTKAFERINWSGCRAKKYYCWVWVWVAFLIFWKKMQQQLYYTAIEIDEVVTDLANRYTLQYLQSNIQVITSDAYAFVMQTEERYDLICMDVFESDKVPALFEEQEFVEELKDRLTENGILLYNRLATRPQDILKSNDFYKNIFSKVFPNSIRLDVQGNWILMNDRSISKTL